MNKHEKEIAKAQLSSEEKTLKELQQVFKKARQDVQEKISELNSRTDMQNLQSIIYQKKYQQAILDQINETLADLNSGQYKTVEDFLVDSYDNGYIGMMYSLQSQGIPMTIPINDRNVVRALTTDSKLSSKYYQSNPLKGRLAENVDLLKQRVRSNLSRGIIAGKSWLDVAVDITSGMNNPFDIALKDAMRIVRTEGHRVHQQGFLDAGDKAKDKGADILKQWDATMDRKTRPAHQQADGQIVEWDDYFSVGGEKMKAPSVGGSAKNVCNCRCQLLQRARWALDESELEILQKRSEYFGLDKSESFEDYKQKYLKLPEKADTMEVKNPFGFNMIQGEHGLFDDTDAVNKHHYNSGYEYKVNCQRCVPTWEMRRRGYDVEALPRIMNGRDETAGHWKDIFQDAHWKENLGSKNATVKKNIIQMVESWGDGSRGEIYCAWKGGSAHVFAVENVGGKVMFIDPQTGGADVEYYFDHMKPTYTKILRTDNLEPSDWIKTCCKNKEE